MREVARLLLEAQKTTPLIKVEDFFILSNFPHIVSAVQVVAGYSSQDNTYNSLTLKLGRSLNKICSIAESNAVICVNQSMAQPAWNLRIIYQMRWNELTSTGALTTLKEAKWNTPQILLFTQDVKCFNISMRRVSSDSALPQITMPPLSRSFLLKKLFSTEKGQVKWRR